MEVRIFFILGAISLLIAIPLVLGVYVFSQEPKYDRIFNTPQYNNTMYITMYNGTVYETYNFRQIVFYNWSDLSENAKRIVNRTMVLNGYTESERSLHFD